MPTGAVHLAGYARELRNSTTELNGIGYENRICPGSVQLTRRACKAAHAQQP